MSEVIRVLHVDDSAADRALVRDALERETEGFQVFQAESRTDLEARLAERAYDVVLSDFHLPGLEGLTVMRIVREKCPDLPVIILTGTGSEETAVEAMKAGAADYVIKTPRHIRRLPFSIRAVLERVRLEARNRAYAEALRASEARYRSIVENACEVILVAQDERIRFINGRVFDVLGYRPEEMIDRPFVDFIHPEDRVLVLERHRLRMRGMSSEPRYPFRVLHRTGKTKWVETNIVPITWEERRATLNFLRDITRETEAREEQERLRRQLQQAQKLEALGQLAGGVAHDFNNMLSVIIGYAELGLKRSDPLDRLHRHFQEIFHAGLRSREITQQLLIFARKQEATPQVIDLNERVEGILKILRRLIGEQITLTWRPGEDLRPVRIDPVQIEQILVNLCVNARDAIAGHGEITIETGGVRVDRLYHAQNAEAAEGDYVRLSVRDDGCGMTGETLEQIFDPFFTTKGEGEGTGLGLSTVYGIVRQNGGFIVVESEPGEGTRFDVHLPCHEGSPSAQRSEGRGDFPHGTGETILVVDDEAAIVELSESILLDLGYDVLVANTPKEALDVARRHSGPINLLLCDLVMPGMSGLDLAGQLRARHPSLKLLMISGYPPDTPHLQEKIGEGVHFLPKPFSVEGLAEKVREVIDGSP